jgi:hypothetical protein
MNDKEIIKKAMKVLNSDVGFRFLFEQIAKDEFDSELKILSFCGNPSVLVEDYEVIIKEKSNEIIGRSLVKAFKIYHEQNLKCKIKDIANEAISDMMEFAKGYKGTVQPPKQNE